MEARQRLFGSHRQAGTSAGTEAPLQTAVFLSVDAQHDRLIAAANAINLELDTAIKNLAELREPDAAVRHRHLRHCASQEDLNEIRESYREPDMAALYTHIEALHRLKLQHQAFFGNTIWCVRLSSAQGLLTVDSVKYNPSSETKWEKDSKRLVCTTTGWMIVGEATISPEEVIRLTDNVEPHLPGLYQLLVSRGYRPEMQIDARDYHYQPTMSTSDRIDVLSPRV